MATATVNGVRLHYEINGDADIPLVLVHGSWDSHEDWARVVPGLAASFRVVAYDRRGHSRSERPHGQGSVRDDVADLAGLIERLGLAPAWVAGNSFGASIALRLAAERPALLRGVVAHDPPLFGLLADDPATAPMLDTIRAQAGTVAGRIASGDHAGAAETFVEMVALGPGAWARLPPRVRAAMVENAPTFLDEANDPDQFGFDPDRLAAFDRPLLLTTGDRSPPVFAPVMRRLARAQPAAIVHTFPGAGHIPHVTHPDDYVAATARFIRAGEARSPART